MDHLNHPRTAHYRSIDLEILSRPQIFLQCYVRRRYRPQARPTLATQASPCEPIPLTDVDPLDRRHRRPSHDQGQKTAIKGRDRRHRQNDHMICISLYNRLLNGQRIAKRATQPLQEIIQQLQPLQQTIAQQVSSDQPQAEQLWPPTQQEEKRYREDDRVSPQEGLGG